MTSIDSLSDDAWLTLVRQAISMPDAPPQLLARALELWRLHRPPPYMPPHRAPQSRQRWVALLSFDSWGSPPVAAGMRALPADFRQLLFTTGVCDVDLRIAPAAEGYALSGQLLGPDGAGSVELAPLGGPEAATLRRTVALDAQSEFRIDGVHSGSYLVTVRLAADEIVLPPIDVGSRRRAGGP
jgi:hypothetical protein